MKNSAIHKKKIKIIEFMIKNGKKRSLSHDHTVYEFDKHEMLVVEKGRRKAYSFRSCGVSLWRQWPEFYQYINRLNLNIDAIFVVDTPLYKALYE